MELCTLLAPVAALMLQHREPRMLEEATRALRWLLIEPEDPSVPAPAGGAVHMLPSKVRTIATLCTKNCLRLHRPFMLIIHYDLPPSYKRHDPRMLHVHI